MDVCVMVDATPSCGSGRGISKDSGHLPGFATDGLQGSTSVMSVMVDVRISEEILLRAVTTQRAS
jgi:hypothetical protein